MAERPSTPPRHAPGASAVLPNSPLTPEQVKRMEINRLKAKALREQREASERLSTPNTLPSTSRIATAVNSGSNLVAGQKRPYSATKETPATQRDARVSNGSSADGKFGGFRPLDDIQPARNFSKFVEYDFSKMTDTKGGFLSLEDDPHNKALHALGSKGEEKPANMTMKEWERQQLLRSLQNQRAGPFEPGLSVLKKGEEQQKVCRECGTMEIDWKWEEILGVSICSPCRDKYPDKYSLLTKTEAKEDYLLTDPELKDEELLPHLERPNPHKSTWNNMMLYVRFQVEDYAFNTKWGSAEALDEEFTRREDGKKRRKEDKFKSKLQELKKRTRVEAYRRSRQAGGRGGEFGDEVDRGGKHSHVWGRAVDNEEGVPVKSCVECGMEVEELEF